MLGGSDLQSYWSINLLWTALKAYADHIKTAQRDDRMFRDVCKLKEFQVSWNKMKKNKIKTLENPQ